MAKNEKDELEKAIEQEMTQTPFKVMSKEEQQEKIKQEREEKEAARQRMADIKKARQILSEETEMFELQCQRMKVEMEHFEISQEYQRFIEQRQNEYNKKMEADLKKAEAEDTKKKESKIIKPTPEQVNKLSKSK